MELLGNQKTRTNDKTLVREVDIAEPTDNGLLGETNQNRLPENSNQLKDILDVVKNNNTLSTNQQLYAFGIGLFITTLMIVALSLIPIVCPNCFQEIGVNGEKIFATILGGQLLLASTLSGLFGGAARTLKRFLMEFELYDAQQKDQFSFSLYLDRWFAPIFSSFIGGASGLLFMLAVYLGLVQIFSLREPPQQLIPVFPALFLSAIGGIFSDEVFSVLNGLFTTLAKNK